MYFNFIYTRIKVNPYDKVVFVLHDKYNYFITILGKIWLRKEGLWKFELQFKQ